jgi:hypothetical protein
MFYELSAEINQKELFCAIFISGSTWILFNWALLDLDLDPDPDPVSKKLIKVKILLTLSINCIEI